MVSNRSTTSSASTATTPRPTGNHWLLVLRPDPDGKRDALGATRARHRRRRLRAGRGRAWSRPPTATLRSNDPRAHFGLGKIDKVQSIEVTWPDGSRERFAGSPVDGQVTLKQGAGNTC